MKIRGLNVELYNKNLIDHKNLLINLSNDDVVRRYFYDFEQYVRNYELSSKLNPRDSVYVVKVKDKYIGMMIFGKIRNNYYLSYAILPEYRNQGYGTAMLSYFVDYLFYIYDDLPSLNLSINDTNIYSIKTALNVGFEHSGYDKYTIKNDSYDIDKNKQVCYH